LFVSSIPQLLWSCFFADKNKKKKKKNDFFFVFFFSFFSPSSVTAAGIWSCSACKKTITGGAYVMNTSAAATVRATIRRLRELVRE
jgi:hypothetical protein